jgi:predicted transcriptional regulator
MTTTLKKAFDKAAELPEAQQEAFAKFLLEELDFVTAVQEGVDAAERGETVSIEDARAMIPKWISESSSRNWH